ncbi:DUF4132 domain-containing protein [Streptomyces sp. NPDC090022]|uniref:DUF4132 domain-containing protein n=1 Tax=Streptomyces sp. NPDC090022 TaxID=3365920 RepID=UPI00380A41C6
MRQDHNHTENHTQDHTTENVFTLPDSWKRNLHPRRGGAHGPVPAVDPRAVPKAEALVARAAGWIAEMLGAPDSDPELVAAVRRHQDGRPDPVGAAVLAQLTRGGVDDAGFVVDAWAATSGLPFAARAAVEFDEIRLRYTQSGTVRTAEGVDGQPESGGGWGGAPRPLADRARALLAVADGATYEAAVEALAAHRHTPRRRVTVSYLVPTERAWVTECCADRATAAHPDFAVRARLLCALGSAEQLALLLDGAPRLALGHRGWNPALIATVAEGIGPALAPLLAAELTDPPYPLDAGAVRMLAESLAELPADAAFAALLEGGRDAVQGKQVRPALLAAARRFPVRALRLLAQAVLAEEAGDGPAAAKAGGATRRLLVGHVAAHRAQTLAALADLPETAAALVGPLAREDGRLPEADAAGLPAVLTSPPWTREREVVEPPVVTGLAAPGEGHVRWLPGERESWAAAEVWTNPWAETDMDRLAEQLRAGRLREDDVLRLFARGPVEVVRPLLEQWEGPLRTHHEMDAFRPVVAAHGPVALSTALAVAERMPGSMGPLLLPLVDVRVARLMADWLVRLKAAGRTARTWLLRHGAAAAPLLVPDALARPGRARTAAEAALTLIAREHGADVVRAAAAGYGPEAAAGIEVLLGADPFEAALPAKLPVPGAWADERVLPQIALRSGTALPAAATRHVLMMLALSRSDSPYPGLAAVRALAEPASLAAFAWEVFEEWRLAGMEPGDAWAVHALGLLGDDGTARRLAPVIRAWPGEGAHHRAVDGLDALAAIGTDTALLSLHQIAQRVRFKALKARATEKVDEVAAGLGLTGEQLADRLVPDLGLDAAGSMVIDYGVRCFTVGFDAQLAPYVLDGAGKRLKNLPAPGAQDDAGLAQDGRKRFAALKKEVRATASDQVRRLESAMVRGRTWTGAEFRRLFVEHPLVGHLTRRLVWHVGPGAEPAAGGTPVAGGMPAGAGAPAAGGAPAAFRVAPDGSYADVDGMPVTVADDAVITLPHPLLLGAPAVARWSARFADEALTQPFPQLERPVFTPTAEESGSYRLARFEGVTVPVGAVLGLTRRGWERGAPADAGTERWISRRLGERCHVVIALRTGIQVGTVDRTPDQTLETVWLDTLPGDHFPRREHTWRVADLDPVLACEVLADLTALTAATGGTAVSADGTAISV